MIRISGLIFDLDGTLADSAPDIAGSVKYTLKTLGLPPRSGGEVRRFIGDGMRTLLERATGRTEKPFLDRAVEVFRPHYMEHCLDRTRLYPGAVETLRFFRRKPMAVVTNKPVAMTVKILRGLGIERYFRTVLGGESVSRRKPHPEPIMKALRILGTDPADTLVVGDGTADMLAGRAAGTPVCAAAYGYKSRAELDSCRPDHLIRRLKDLRKIAA